MTTETQTPETKPTVKDLVKLVWLPTIFVKGERVTEHRCYRTSPAIEFKPFGDDEDDQRAHAMVPASFAEFLVNDVIDPATGGPVYAYAEEVAPFRAAPKPARRIGADVIVLGEHHHGRLASFFGNNTDEEVQAQAGVDVILA